MGPQQGQKVFTLQTIQASNEGEFDQISNTSGFSLHAGISCRGILPMPTNQRNKKGYAALLRIDGTSDYCAGSCSSIDSD